MLRGLLDLQQVESVPVRLFSSFRRIARRWRQPCPGRNVSVSELSTFTSLFQLARLTLVISGSHEAVLELRGVQLLWIMTMCCRGPRIFMPSLNPLGCWCRPNISSVSKSVQCRN
jgi:hypothetical protein